MGYIEGFRDLYEKFPYPPTNLFTPFLVKIRPDDLPLLNWQCLLTRALGAAPIISQPRILVLGCGTVEASVVALANPGVRIVAVDFSETSLKKATWFAQIKGVRHQIQFLKSDLRALPQELGLFDLIIATGVLHHLENPDIVLQHLLRFAREHCAFRFMVYSYWARELIYETRDLLNILGIDNADSLRMLMNQLPSDHPYRIYFELYQDSDSTEGLYDGYLHPCDKPFTTINLKEWLERAGLELKLHLMAPEENPLRAESIKEFTLDPWKKMQILELTAQLERNFTFLCTRKNIREVEGANLQWCAALSKSGSFYSRLLGRKLQVDLTQRPENLTNEQQMDLANALFVYRRGKG